MKIRLFENKSDCCGCAACAAICGKSAITMQEDEKGFLLPVINESLCIQCGKCIKTCNYQKDKKNFSNLYSKEVYAAYADDVNLQESASGGIFSGIAKEFLRVDGVIYGAALLKSREDFHVLHKRIDSEEGISLIKGSKYIQSSVLEEYKKIRQDLQNQKKVLFSGTPCQIRGLKGFLSKEYDNLYTIEVVCHGVPSVKFFNDYIHFVENTYNVSIEDFRFRDKSDGWVLKGKVDIKHNDGSRGQITFDPEESSYYQMFLNSYTYRESCYECPYASKNRAGDITIGDYWCIDLVHPEFLIENGGEIDEKAGASCIVVNSEKGKELLDLYGIKIKKFISNYENASKYNGQLVHPSLKKDERETVLELYRNGYENIEKWYQKRLKRVKVKRKMRSLVPKSLKKLRRKILRMN